MVFQKKLLSIRVARIAKNEFRAAWRDGRLVFLALTSWLLFLFALYVGFGYYRSASTDRTESQKRVRTLWLEQADKHPHAAGHYGTYAFKPLSVFNLMEKGIDPYTGQAIRLETHLQNPPEIRAAGDATFLLRSGELTIGFAFLYVIPLLIVVVAHGVVCREREQGTLKLVMCQGLRPYQLLLGKILGAATILSVIIFPVMLVLGIVLFWHGAGEASLFSSAMVLLLGYSAYFLVFLFFSIGVSAASATSRRALLLLFAFWITVCVVVPKLSAFISEWMYPTPSAYTFTNDIEQETLYGSYEAIAYWQELLKKTERELMEKYQVSSPDSLPMDRFGYTLQAREEEGHAAYERNYARIDSLFLRQNGVHAYLSVLSPLSNMRFIAMGVAGSAVGDYFHFIGLSENYRQDMMDVLNSDVMENQKRGQKGYTAGRTLWERVPDYVYEPRTFQERLADYRSSFLLLAVWLGLSLVFVCRSVRRLH